MVAGCLTAALAGQCATIPLWTNSGTITFPPQIDALAVRNDGWLGTQFFPLFTSFPFDTSNTQNFTNNRYMYGSVGFRFDNAPRNSSGQPIAPRKLANWFQNRSGAGVTAYDGPLQSGYSGSYIWVHATNIINAGTLTAGAAGEIQVIGTNVNLNRGGLQIGSITPQGSFNGTTNFLPDVAIYDVFWEQTNITFNTRSLLTGQDTNITVISPVFPVQGLVGAWQIGFLNPIMAGYSNLVGTLALTITNMDGSTVETNVVTNFVQQAVFVEVADRTNVGTTITFSPSSEPTNFFMTAEVQLAFQSTNAVSQGLDLNTIALTDTLASESERGLLVNFYGGGLRPTNYILSRLPFEGGFGPNVPVTTNFFWRTNSAVVVATGEYAGYSAFVDNLVSQPANIPAGTVTNLPGRVKVSANDLDLTRTRIRAEGLISIEARNTVVSSNAVVDSEHLAFDLTDTTGQIQVQNLMKPSVNRARGYVFMWSATWTNSIIEVIDNYTFDADENPVPAPITNIVSVAYHALLFDARDLLVTLPVTVHDLRVNSTNISISDTGILARSFLLRGESVTISGGLTLSGVLENWVYTNTPGVRYFTNNGAIYIPNEAHFGDDTPTNYAAFVNRGVINANSVNILTASNEFGIGEIIFEGGQISAAASVNMESPSARLEGGSVDAGGDIFINAGVLRLHRQSLTATDGGLYLMVTNTLTDSGGSASNVITVHNGFNLPSKPQSGDLLGTQIQTSPLLFAEAVHTWAGTNHGAIPSGFKDNVAIGRLSLSVGLFAQLTFKGASTTPDVTNALYVDYLELDNSVASDLANTLSIAPNLVIYFADANVSVHTLDGQFGGRLRWVRNFAGPNSSVMAVINGALVPVNRALRQSTQIDSDADGLANGFDPSPFDPVSFTVTVESNYAVLTWRGAVGTAYTVEWATNLSAPAWRFLLSTNHPWSTNALISVRDPEPMGLVPRVYRVSYAP